MIPFPDKQYDIVYADPCWEYREVNYNPKGETSKATNHYPTMQTQEMCNLPVIDIASKNCLLFLWVTNVHIPDALIVGESWGFKFSTVGFIWYKGRKNPGHYTMSECEQCWIFKRGKIPQPRGKENIGQFLSCKRGRHSEKPKEIRHRITEMFPTQSKIELFARPDWTDYDGGWDFWGK